MDQPINIPKRRREMSDMVRVNARHYQALCTLAETGGYDSLGALVAAILDATLPRVKLVERPRYDIVITDE